ncbi:MAG: hypothetical protein ABW033_10520 [Acidimicrobiia bacterium]
MSEESSTLTRSFVAGRSKRRVVMLLAITSACAALFESPERSAGAVEPKYWTLIGTEALDEGSYSVYATEADESHCLAVEVKMDNEHSMLTPRRVETCFAGSASWARATCQASMKTFRVQMFTLIFDEVARAFSGVGRGTSRG